MTEAQPETSTSDDEIITSIYTNKRSISAREFTELASGPTDNPIDEYQGINRFLFRYGSKSIVLIVDKNARKFSTFIKNTGGNRQENETTLLYKAAKKMMQEISISEASDYDYKLSTKNEKMQRWAKAQGQELFHWEEVSDASDAFRSKIRSVLA